ncbi:MAG: NHLP leader peptide family RiPP precursor [Pseudomonadales bacterium]|nr:NHLP leader peptide family RiPP precursor [Pseudomonadales bacterium]
MPSAFVQTALQTAEEMRAQLTEKAIVDADFRQQLLADPKGAIKQEFGVEVPEGINIVVQESDMRTLYIALPAGPDLDEEQLEAIAAGMCCCL